MEQVFTFDHDFIAVAHGDGVLSADEAYGLESLVDSDEWETVPEWLHDAVEKLFLYSIDTSEGPTQ